MRAVFSDDFKPASVDTNKIATVDVGNNHQVTVTVPHLGKWRVERRHMSKVCISDGAGVPQTVFKGSQRPYQKECVLIIDRVTGEITLEKLACNIQVKKTRSESAKLPLPQGESDAATGTVFHRLLSERLSQVNDRSGTTSNLSSRSQTPPIGQRISHKTKVTSGSRRPDRPITHLVPKHSPLHASPSYPSPNHHKSPKRDTHINE
jgi:ELL-associated factor